MIALIKYFLANLFLLIYSNILLQLLNQINIKSVMNLILSLFGSFSFCSSFFLVKKYIRKYKVFNILGI